MKSLRIGTRGSDLALAQSLILQIALSQAYPELSIDTIVIRTQGDVRMDAPLGIASPLDRGAFTKELETALLQKTAHVAVQFLNRPADLRPCLGGLVLPRVVNGEDFKFLDNARILLWKAYVAMWRRVSPS